MKNKRYQISQMKETQSTESVNNDNSIVFMIRNLTNKERARLKGFLAGDARSLGSTSGRRRK